MKVIVGALMLVIGFTSSAWAAEYRTGETMAITVKLVINCERQYQNNPQAIPGLCYGQGECCEYLEPASGDVSDLVVGENWVWVDDGSNAQWVGE